MSQLPAAIIADLDQATARVRAGSPIDRSDARVLFEHGPNELLMSLATLVRNRLHPAQQATYIKMAIVNYTNVCVAKCDYCAFYRLPHQAGTYLLSFDEVCSKVDALLAFGGKLVGFNGGFHPKLQLEDYAKLFRRLHERYGDELTFFEMTVAEFMFSCKLSRLSYAAGAELLRESGTRWVTGGGAEILDDAFRKRHSPGKYTVADYFSAQRAILAAGIGSTATMVIGFDESLDERFNHLEALRQFQEDHDRGLVSFLCWTYKPHHNALGGEEIATQEYLRWLAVSRIYLHNIPHIRTSVLTKNEDALVGLRYGADDFDLPTEDEVTQKAGATVTHDFERILTATRQQGYEPVLRGPFAAANKRQHLTIPMPIGAARVAAL